MQFILKGKFYSINGIEQVLNIITTQKANIFGNTLLYNIGTNISGYDTENQMMKNVFHGVIHHKSILFIVMFNVLIRRMLNEIDALQLDAVSYKELLLCR